MPSLSLLLPLSPRPMLIPGMATDTVDMDTAATTGLMATMATTERGPQMPRQSLLLPLTLTLTLMLGTDTMATDTVATDTVAMADTDMADAADMAAMATTERGPQMLSLSLLLPLTLALTLMLGTDTMATDTVATDTV